LDLRAAEEWIARVRRAAAEDDEGRAGGKDGAGSEAVAQRVRDARQGAGLKLIATEIQISRG